jgi:hypothetical protein
MVQRISRPIFQAKRHNPKKTWERNKPKILGRTAVFLIPHSLLTPELQLRRNALFLHC